MILTDQFQYALGHLRMTRLRTILTAAGVAIGIGAMTSMVSVGVGTQRKVMQAFSEENILTSVMVRPGDFAEVQGGSAAVSGDSLGTLDMATVDRFRALRGVRDAFPILTVPGVLELDGDRHFQTLEGMPSRHLKEQIETGRITLTAGRPYEEGEEGVLLLSRRAAGRMVPEGTAIDSLVGRSVSFLVARAPTGGTDSEVRGERAAELAEEFELPPAMQALPFSSMLQQLPFRLFEPVELKLEIIGIIEGAGTLTDFLGTSIWVPVGVVEQHYSSAFRSLETVLTGETRGDTYPMVQILTEDIIAVRAVQDEVRAMGFRAESILDEIDEIRRAFVLMNGFLAMIGGISLVVAAMMIVNTLVMAVLERTQEIGLLKSMGAADGDVMRLFLTEAGVIGLLGGTGGLILGWVVALITNALANLQFHRVGEVSVDLVAFPLWLIAGGYGFAVLVSLIAGYYPSRRAARVDPVVALRHF